MYGKEEAKQLRKDFWTTFGQISKTKRMALGKSRSWITYNTGINEVYLKFEASRKSAIVAIDIDSKHEYRRERFYERFLAFKNILNDEFDNELNWDSDYLLEDGRSISRIYIEKTGISFYNKEEWGVFFEFFFDNMIKLEDFYLEYKDIIARKDQ